MRHRQAGFVSLEGVVIGTAIAVIALYMALVGDASAIFVFFGR